MSNGFVKAETNVLFNNDLDVVSKFVLISLKYWDRGSGRGCFAKKETISQMLNISLHQLRKSLTKLEDLGLILIHKRGQGLTDVIRVVEESEIPDTENLKSSTIHYRSKKREIDLEPVPIKDCKEKETDCAKSSTIVSNEQTSTNTKPLTEDDYKRFEDVVGVDRMELYCHDLEILDDGNDFITFVLCSEISRDFIVNVFGNEIREVFKQECYFTWRR